MNCPRCRHENESGAKFCEACAAPLLRTCTHCGHALSAAAKFCPECAHLAGTASGHAGQSRFGSLESYTPKHLAERILTSKAALEGERKQVTVLFADLKGSMELLADRDPEDARKLLDPVLEHMMEAVHRYEGTVNQVMGDGIMALFGAPLSHEDHAVRACYAALRMQESVKRYADGVWRSDGVRVQIRVGLNSGEVVVRSIGSDLRMDYTAVGQTTHLAARMEQTATPGTILLAGDTLRLAEGFVQVKPLGPTPVKGLAAPVEVYELTGASPVRSRLQATAARGLTKFVGRNAEIEALVGGLQQARASRGQVVAIVGEPGVGKSRLVWEFTHSHRTQGCLVLEGSSVSYGKATTYLPVIELLKRYFAIEPRDDARKIREKATGKLFSLDRALEPCLAPLLWLLDAPAADAEWDRLDPVLRRQRLHESIRRLLLREAHEQPLVCVFEDLHWIDGETQALLDGLVESLPTACVLLLVNYRPEYQHGWGSKTYYTRVRLDPLPATSAAELLAALLGPDASVQPLVPMLIARTEGNPFFLEETVQSIVEAGALSGERGAYRLVRTPAALNIPATAQAILSARMDRLAPEDKRLLQTAAVIGKDIPYPLLRAIAELDEPALRAGLARLQAAEFVYEVQLFPELEYTFKHALTHDVAYGTLVVDRRRQLHACLVEAIEQVYAGRLDEQAERLAQHAARGEVWERAIDYARQAAERAMARSAYAVAAQACEDALAALSQLPRSHETLVSEVDLTVQLADLRGPLGELEPCRVAAERALSLAGGLGDPGRLGRACSQIWGAHWRLGDSVGALSLAERALALAEAGDDVVRQAGAQRNLAMSCHSLGDYRRAIGLLQQAGQTFIESPAARSTSHITQGRAWINTFAWLAWCLAELGEFDRARTAAEEGARLAATDDAPIVQLGVLWGLVTPAVHRGDFADVIMALERGVALTRETDVRYYFTALGALLGYAYARSGRVPDGIELLAEVTRRAKTWNRVGQACWLSFQSEALLLAGRRDAAHDVARCGLDGARERCERGDEARCLRALAEVEAYGEEPAVEAAHAGYEQALALATELGMRPLVAHCHLGLSKLYRRAGKREEAREHLTTATAMYREMDMQFWLEQAEADQRQSGSTGRCA